MLDCERPLPNYAPKCTAGQADSVRGKEGCARFHTSGDLVAWIINHIAQESAVAIKAADMPGEVYITLYQAYDKAKELARECLHSDRAKCNASYTRKADRVDHPGRWPYSKSQLHLITRATRSGRAMSSTNMWSSIWPPRSINMYHSK